MRSCGRRPSSRRSSRSLLFILVFGLSLGGRIHHVDGVPYEAFIVPGLITMAMIQATYANNSASVFQARFDRYLNDVLAAPMRRWEINLALSLGGVVRAIAHRRRRCCSASLPIVDVPIREPLVLLARARAGARRCSRPSA